MNNSRIFFILAGLFLSIATSSWAQNKNEMTKSLNITLSTLNTLEHQINKQNNSYRTLKQIKSQLEQIATNATTCITEANGQNKKIDKILGYISPGPSTSINEYNAFLIQERAANKQKLADCSFISYRSDEMSLHIKLKIFTLASTTSWTRTSSIWALIQKTPFTPAAFNTNALYEASGLSHFSKTQYIEIVFFAVFDLLMACFVFFFIARQTVLQSETLKGLTIFKHSMFMIIVTFCALLSLYFTFRAIAPIPGIVLLNAIFLCYLLGIAVLKYFLLWLKERLSLTRCTSAALFRRTLVLFTVILIGSAGYTLLRGMNVSEEAIALLNVIITTATLLSVFWLSWVLFPFEPIKSKSSLTVHLLMKSIIASLYFIVIALFLAGYHNQALMIIPKLMGSACILSIAFQLIRLVARLQNDFYMNKKPFAKALHRKLGFKDGEISPELAVIRSLIYFTICMFSSMFLLVLWGTPEMYIDQIRNTLHDGIVVFDATIVPVRIGRALFLFFLITLIGRFLSAYIMRKDAFKKEKHVQLTISTLVRYVTFIIATVLCLYIAGISFKGVAIVIGALLVGVGFGLQKIVGDFIAGLVLLSNNVVRPGDYVQIGTVEGVVKKIRLLATEIQTPYPNTVLLPNSSLMNTSVVNYTYQGKLLHIRLKIVIENVLDIERAKELAFEATTKNPGIVNNEHSRPSIQIEIYEALGHMSAHLILIAAIPATSNRDVVLSELSSEILAVFKQKSLPVQVP